jgi:hypothetical protein
MGFYTLDNKLTVNPDNANEGYNNSWIQVENNANRLLYAQANYVTNFDDMKIILSAADVRIGAVEICDVDNNNLRVSVANTAVGGALRVLSQDLESDVDTVSLGDVYNNKVAINIPLSALNVYTTNVKDMTSVFVTNQLTGFATSNLQTSQNNNLISQINWLKALSSTRVTILNQVTGFSTEANQLTEISLLQTLTSLNADASLPLLQGLSSIRVTLLNPTLGFATSALQTSQINWLKALSSTRVTILNPTLEVATSSLQLEQISLLQSLSSTSVSVLNPLTGYSTEANQLTEIILLQSLSSTSVTLLNPLTGYSTEANQLTEISLLQSLSSTLVTVLNPLTGYSTDSLQLEQISLLNSLTSINTDSINGLLQGLSSTSVTILNSVTGFSTELNQLEQISLLQSLSSTVVTVLNPVTAVSLINSVSTINFTNTHITVGYGDNSGNLDAFSRLRVSTPTTLFDSKTLHNKSSMFWNQVASGAEAAVNFTGEFVDPSVTLSAINVDEYAIRQTTQRFNYQPGKSQLALFTGIMKPEDHAIKRYGLFQSLTSAPYTPNIGLYFETLTTSPTAIAVVQANEGFLVPSLSATRDHWNIDKLDGTGPSGKVLQLSAANIFLIDFEWLGVGRARFGTVIDGQICYCHQFNNAGNVQGAYMRTCNLPVRAELRQVASGASTLKMICCSVMSEGGADFTGLTRAVDSGASISIAAGNRRAILGVRLQYNKLDSVNEILNTSVAVLASNSGNASSAYFKYEILHNPIVAAGGTWQDVDVNSNFQYWRGSTTVQTNGTIITSGFSSAGGTIDLSGYRFEKFLRMGCSIDGRRDELYLVITPLQANDGVFGSLTFIESD